MSVTDHRTVPPGVVPRHLQQWLLIGIALVMVGIMALSGSPTRPRAIPEPPAGAPAVDPNQQRIEEYQKRIQEQTQRLAAEQAQLQLTKDAASAPTFSPPPPTGPGPGNPIAAAPGNQSSQSSQRDPAPARISDNVAFSKDAATLPPAPTAPAAAPQAPQPASTVERTDQRRYRVSEGTLIDTVLTNRLDGTFTGPVNCLVSVPVYASDQQHIVIPAGARVLGESRAVNTFGQSRLAVVFHRVLQPNGARIDLNGFHGLNQVGDLGLQDQVDRHYQQIFGVSLAIGAIAGFAQAQSAAGLDATGLDLYRQGVAANVSQSSARVLDRFLNLLPTVTIREGHRIKIYLANDLELPAYSEPGLATGGPR
jgi:type IV secretory pathway VirB10-like protein